jgi:beta-N-acetylhexosaminidase
MRGEISEERIDASVQRLAQLKAKRGITKAEPKAFAEIQPLLASEESLETARLLSEQSITLLCDDGQLPLVKHEDIYVIWPEVRINHEVIEALQEEITLGNALKPYFGNVSERIIDVDPSAEEIALVLEETLTFTQIVAATYNADFSPGQRQILQELTARTGCRLIVVAVRNPYDFTAVPGIRTYIASYENKPLAMQSVAKVLAGQSFTRGALPVTVGAFAYGSGILS